MEFETEALKKTGLLIIRKLWNPPVPALDLFALPLSHPCMYWGWDLIPAACASLGQLLLVMWSKAAQVRDWQTGGRKTIKVFVVHLSVSSGVSHCGLFLLYDSRPCTV